MSNNQTIHIILHNQDDEIICPPFPKFNCFSSPPSPHKIIKKQLKKVVQTSNFLQDAVNILKSMLNNNSISLEELMVQRRHIAILNSQQQDEIRKLQHLEFKYPEEKRNRFFYFREVTIPWP